MKKMRITDKKIGSQMRLVYCIAVFLPLIILSSFLISHTVNTQISNSQEILMAFNDGVSQTIYEIFGKIYSVSDSIVYNDDLIDFLNGSYENEQELRIAAADTEIVDRYAKKYGAIEDIRVYIDRVDMVNCGRFYKVTDEIRCSDWYVKASEQYLPFWTADKTESVKGKQRAWNLYLVRKMVLVGGDREAVIQIKVNDAYLGSRISSSNYTTMLAIDNQPVIFSTKLDYYGEEFPEPILTEAEGNLRIGKSVFEGDKVLMCMKKLSLSRCANEVYLLSYDMDAYSNIWKMLSRWGLVVALASVLPLVLTMVFTKRFSSQVMKLRIEMGKASKGEYESLSNELTGSREIKDAFDDLLRMVRNIQDMEAGQYEARLREQSIKNDQQRMEYKVLASQINPHFLYNTLETIRMKALTAGDKEVANAIKLLGKSMRYVLEHTGNASTTLQKEIDHVLIYLQIQQLRFGDRVNYEVHIEPGLKLEEIISIPLLLQPIVENAIVHGLEKKESNGRIWIAVYSREKIIHIDISDNGSGIAADELERLLKKVNDYEMERRSSIGLYNINRRIKLSYGEEFGLEILSTLGEGTRVSVLMPEKYLFEVNSVKL